METGLRSHLGSALLGAGVCAAVLGTAGAAKMAGAGHGSCCLTDEQQLILQHMSLIRLDDGQGAGLKTVRFSGVNLQIVNGSGATNGFPADPGTIDPEVTATNGLGNLIVGYNEPFGAGDVRTGSHNVVVGAAQSYTSYGGLVAGYHNEISGAYASAGGGERNRATGDFSWVSGGHGHEASGLFSSIAGGGFHRATGVSSAVFGGGSNQALADAATVFGGRFNRAIEYTASVTGGLANLASGPHSVVGGGSANEARGSFSVVSGGLSRSVAGDHDWRAGSLFEDD